MKTKLLRKARKIYTVKYNSIDKYYELHKNNLPIFSNCCKKIAIGECRKSIIYYSKTQMYRYFKTVYPPKN